MIQYEIHAYLAGPDVFFPDAVAIGERKKAFLKTLGIHGHFPFDNELPKDVFSDPLKAARMIADANERMMEACCDDGRIGVILLNMVPFHGPSMDCGTAFEAGYMAALSRRKNVIIVGYSGDARLFEERVIEEIYHGQGVQHVDGVCYGPDGNMIESFGGADNLMITAAIARTGGRVCASFEEAAQLARDLVHALITTLNKGL